MLFLIDVSVSLFVIRKSEHDAIKQPIK